MAKITLYKQSDINDVWHCMLADDLQVLWQECESDIPVGNV